MFVRIFLKPLSFIPALLLMYMIYNFSAQPGDVSSQLSYKVSYKIVETADKILGTDMEGWEVESWSYRIHGFTRKLAHMAEYFALAVAISFPLYVYGIRGIWLMLLAGLICVGFACGDEYHQAFVDGRGPSKRDVAIDSFGAFWGIILVRIVGWTGRKTIFRPFAKKKKPKKKTLRSKTYEPEDIEFEEEVPYRQGAPVFYKESPYAQYDNGMYGQPPYPQSNPEYIRQPYPGPQPSAMQGVRPEQSPYWHQMEEIYGKDTPLSEDTRIYSQKPYVSQDTRVYRSALSESSVSYDTSKDQAASIKKEFSKI